MAIFDGDARDNIVDGALDEQYALDARDALLIDLPPNYVASLTRPGVSALIQFESDFDRMNQHERIADGVIPLRSWLRRAFRLAQKPANKLIFESARIELEHKMEARPSVQIPAGSWELKEAIIFHDEMVPFSFLELGHKAGLSVARLQVPRYDNGVRARSPGGAEVSSKGTGWLIGGNLLLTNHHVVNCREQNEAAASQADLLQQCANSAARFDFNYDGAEGKTVECEELLAWDRKLDYAVLRLSPLAPARFPLPLAPDRVESPQEAHPFPVNIIQHVDGGPKRVALRNNLVTSATNDDLRYFTDTDGGSSGSPVLDDRWRVVGLHRGTDLVQAVKFQGKTTAYVNVGTQIRSVLEDLQNRWPGVHQKISG